ncbi:RNA polymerase sigma-70 factor (ECF subfamily) [Paenibacillus sp. PastF-3]|uniref:RNA polymerase sigma factor n=1 Tax=Paenibacillus sp. PastF-3 TaxID=2940626 RepID=UPI00247503A5|nr:RNA polymerase sigma factor [Paenibacillus sp. PastF-3]MDH6373837.1 RNA polymerase sigma-70 factor (ECF subfamily) [Paenibacillus sp. PastF-3]
MEGNEISEDKWVIEAQQGNEAAVELLIRHTYSDVYRFIRWKIHNDELAWDLAQTVYEKAWTKLGSYQNEQGSFRAWLMAIAQNVCIDYFRSKSARQAELNQSLSDEITDVEDFLDGILLREEVKTIYAAICSLPEDQRDALLLRYKYEFTFTEIAAVTHEPESTVKSRVSRSLMKLRELLKHPIPNDLSHPLKKGVKK